MGQMTSKELKHMEKKHLTAVKKIGKNVITATKVKEYLAELGYRMSGDLIPALAEEVFGLLNKAATRCNANDRTTVRATDL